MSSLLAIETSCDESAVALVTTSQSTPKITYSLISSQIEIHREYGGVVPEVASRSHSEQLPSLVSAVLEESQCALSDFDGFAATGGPGLSSSLLIGHSMAKGFAVANRVPFYSINHMEGHLLSPFIGSEYSTKIPNHLALIVSGGHTLLLHCHELGQYERIGSTRDDAAGEAFDKVARMLGLPYPGGPEIEALARLGNPRSFDFPVSLPASMDFSFSGLKTAVLYTLKDLGYGAGNVPVGSVLHDLCASFQHAVITSLVKKVRKAVRATGVKIVTVSGGVSCNEALRTALALASKTEGALFLPCSREYSTDNAAMVGYLAWFHHHNGAATPLSQNIQPNLSLTA